MLLALSITQLLKIKLLDNFFKMHQKRESILHTKPLSISAFVMGRLTKDPACSLGRMELTPDAKYPSLALEVLMSSAEGKTCHVIKLLGSNQSFQHSTHIIVHQHESNFV